MPSWSCAQVVGDLAAQPEAEQHGQPEHQPVAPVGQHLPERDERQRPASPRCRGLGQGPGAETEGEEMPGVAPDRGRDRLGRRLLRMISHLDSRNVESPCRRRMSLPSASSRCARARLDTANHGDPWPFGQQGRQVLRRQGEGQAVVVATGQGVVQGRLARVERTQAGGQRQALALHHQCDSGGSGDVPAIGEQAIGNVQRRAGLATQGEAEADLRRRRPVVGEQRTGLVAVVVALAEHQGQGAGAVAQAAADASRSPGRAPARVRPDRRARGRTR